MGDISRDSNNRACQKINFRSYFLVDGCELELIEQPLLTAARLRDRGVERRLDRGKPLRRV
eukprot:30004-Pelagococcus_subviridis.AAC.2